MTKEQHEKAIEALVAYFTGGCVAYYSIGLGGGIQMSYGAKAFFEAREACQIRVYATAEEARETLTALFPWKPVKRPRG